MNSYTLSPNIENPSTHPVQNTLQEDNARSGSIPVSLQRQQGHLQSSLFYSILVSTSLSRRFSLHHGDSTESSTEPRSECGPFIKPCLTSINPSHQKICDVFTSVFTFLLYIHAFHKYFKAVLCICYLRIEQITIVSLDH